MSKLLQGKQQVVKPLILFFFVCCLGLTIVSCRPEAPMQHSAEGSLITPNPEGNQSEIWQDWQRSSHADTYDLEKGPNTYCAKCHSPQNWDPGATIGDPPNCVSCKFPHEPEPRIAEANPLVLEEEWKSIGCEVCHLNNEGIIDAQIVWHDPVANNHSIFQDPTELCEMCHLDNETLRHKREMGSAAHVGFTCISCHDAHSTAANCGADGCHVDVVESRDLPSDEHIGIQSKVECLVCHEAGMQVHNMAINKSEEDDCLQCHSDLKQLSSADIAPVYHSLIHAEVNCVVCHDASGYEVGIDEMTDEWVVFRSVELLGRVSVKPYQSHDLQQQVSCNRCHFVDNPWELSVEGGDRLSDGVDG